MVTPDLTLSILEFFHNIFKCFVETSLLASLPYTGLTLLYL